MASRIEYASLVAVRHYKRGQLFAWVNDVEHADYEFRRCLRAIDYVKRRNHVGELQALEEHTRQAPRRRDPRARPITPEESRQRLNRSVPLTHVLLLEASNRAEFRALIHLPPRKLAHVAHLAQYNSVTRDIITDRMLQWVEVDQQAGFTGWFHLTFADGTLYGQIVPHGLLEAEEAERLGLYIAGLVVAKLDI